MEYRIYTYTSRGTPGAPRRRRRRTRKRRGIAPFFLTALLLAIPVVVLSADLPARLEQNTAHALAAEAASPPSAPAAGAPEDGAAVVPGPTRPPASVPDEPEKAADIAYDFSKPVPESAPVDDSYFDDAVFIGDSRTEGLLLNTGLCNTTAYVYKGLMVDTVFTKPVIHKDGQKLSVMDALKTTPFAKAYIMLGINETGWAYSKIFQEKYGDIIDGIREINPDAIIYIQGIIPVSDEVSSSHSYITNEKINEYNALLRELAGEKRAYYVATENAIASGSLPAEAAPDGIHLVKDYCGKWLDYLKTHTAAQ